MGPLLGPELVNKIKSQRGGVKRADIMNETDPSGSAKSRYPACHSSLWQGSLWAVGAAD